MRILQVNSMLTGGGTDDQCLRLAHGLAARGHAVWLAAPEDRELSPRVRELDLRLLPTEREGPLKLGFIRSVARHCREQGVEILHAHHGRDIWPAILAARWSGVRPWVVLTRHLAKSPSSWLSRRFLLSQCDRLIAVSEFVARVLREGVYEPESPVEERRARPPLRGDPRRIVVAQGGIDPLRFQPGDASDQRRAWGLEPHQVAFGVVGGYDLPRGKGQREFLQAAAAIHRRVPDARFLILGRGSMAAILQADIERLGLRGIASLAPYCHDMPRAMNALDCLVHPQVATDAFPTVILEAMACNKPVVATRCDGAPEQFRDGEHGLLVPMEDPTALGAAMERIAGDAAFRARLGQDGRRHVLAHFTLDLLADRVLAIYESMRAEAEPEGRG
ncbi:MAG: glycosyltransferase family 4 protein [Verrucomicrobiales bacterium]|nr:glycosyltransferase family 4 protein [Verrucomicrobiales bacterium]